MNAVAPQDGNVKFTVMPNGGGEGARRADACAPFGFVIAESSLRRLRWALRNARAIPTFGRNRFGASTSFFFFRVKMKQ